MEDRSLNAANGRNGDQGGKRSRLRMQHERDHSCGKDKERASALIVGKEHDPKQHHATDVHEVARPLQPEDSPIKDEKYRGSESVQEPELEAGVFYDGLNEEEAEIQHPKHGAPSVIPVFED